MSYLRYWFIALFAFCEPPPLDSSVRAGMETCEAHDAVIAIDRPVASIEIDVGLRADISTCAASRTPLSHFEARW